MSSLVTTQSGNAVGGNLAARDNNTYNFNSSPQASSPFAKLYQDLRSTNSADPAAAAMSDALQHYTTQTSDIRSLAVKLTDGGRADFIETAEQLKQFAAMKIMKWQTSAITQEIITPQPGGAAGGLAGA